MSLVSQKPLDRQAADKINATAIAASAINRHLALTGERDAMSATQSCAGEMQHRSIRALVSVNHRYPVSFASSPR